MSSSFPITKNLQSHEAECPCCEGLAYEQKFVDYLQILRDMMQIPFVYKPGGFYRCRVYNDSLSNSAKNSQHLSGRAADITTHGWTSNERWRLVKGALSLGMSVGVYSAHVHVDLRVGEPVLFYGSY